MAGCQTGTGKEADSVIAALECRIFCSDCRLILRRNVAGFDAGNWSAVGFGAFVMSVNSVVKFSE